MNNPTEEVDDALNLLSVRLDAAARAHQGGQNVPGTNGQAPRVAEPDGRASPVAETEHGGSPAGLFTAPPGAQADGRIIHATAAPEHQSTTSITGALFIRPERPLHSSAPSLQEPAPPVQPGSTKRRRSRRVFDVSTPVEAALQEYLAMFQGPLPQHVIAALMATFNLDDAHAEALDEAMAMVTGEAIQDIQKAVDALQEDVLQAAA
nr:uncharacterized protein LOC117861920 [Setaria viridis]